MAQAKVNPSSLHNWADGETMHANDPTTSYDQERTIITTAINNNADDVTNNYYTKTATDNLLSKTAGGQAYSIRSGTAFPSSAIEADVFYLTADYMLNGVTYRGDKSYQFIGGNWQEFINNADATISVTLSPGVQVVNNTGEDKAPLRFKMLQGRTLVNIPGRDGNCESLSPFTLFGTAPTLSTTQFKNGSNSIKVTPDSTHASYFYKDYTYKLDTAKQYIALMWVYLASYTTGELPALSFCDTGTLNSRYRTYALSATIGAWQLVKVKIPTANTLVGNGFRLFVGCGNTGDAVAYIDGIRVFEVTASDYSAFDALTTDQVEAKYPYVDDIKPIANPYIYHYGQNLLPPLTEWTPTSNSNVTTSILSDYSFQINQTVAGQYNWEEYQSPAVPGQTYSVSVVLSSITGYSGTNGAYIEVAWLDSQGNVINAPGTQQFTTAQTMLISNMQAPSGTVKARVRVVINTSCTGTFTFTNPMFNLGSTALPFVERNDDFIYWTGNFHSSVDGSVYDSLSYINGVPTKTKRFAEVTLDGSLNWSNNTSGTGYKTVYWLTSAGAGVQDSSVVVKYDGKILNKIPYAAPTVADQQSFGGSNSSQIISIASSDTGWGDSYTPTAAEIQAYFWGWKMNNGTFGTAYNGTGTKTWVKWNATDNTGAVTVCPTTPSAAIDGKTITYYKLVYQLASSVEEAVTYEGAIAMQQGLNQFEVGCGVIVREAAKPQASTNYYNINTTALSGANLQYRDTRFIAVYKNGISDRWQLNYNDANSYGNYTARIPIANYDQTAAYTVTYLALDTYLLGTAPQTISAEYGSEVLTVLADNTQAIADLTAQVSALQNTKANRVQPNWIAPTLLNAWVNYGGSQTIAGYYKDDMGIIHVRGLIKSGNVGSSVLLFTLPIGYRPALNIVYPVITYNGTTIASINLDIKTDGSVQIGAINAYNTWISLDNITFRAEQ